MAQALWAIASEFLAALSHFVIPAQAGIQWAVVKTGRWMRCLDSLSFPRSSRLRGNDRELRGNDEEIRCDCPAQTLHMLCLQ